MMRVMNKRHNIPLDERVACLETDMKWVKWLLGVLVTMDSTIIVLILRTLG